MEDLNNTINQQDLISIYTTFHPRTEKYTYLQEPTKKQTILLAIKNPPKLNITDIRQSVFSDYRELKLKIIGVSSKH